MPAYVASSYADQQRAYHAEIQRLAELAFSMYSQCVYQELYLYGRKEGDCRCTGGQPIYQELTISAEAPDIRWEIVRPVRVSPAWTIELMAHHIQDWLRREPLWIFAS